MKMPDPSPAAFKKANKILGFSMEGTKEKTLLRPHINASDMPTS